MRAGERRRLESEPPSRENFRRGLMLAPFRTLSFRALFLCVRNILRCISVLFVLSVLAAACDPIPSDKAQQRDAVETSNAGEVSSAAATVRAPPELEWMASANAISYMQEETDNVWITLHCAQGSGRIRIEDPLRDQPTSTITLVSGEVTETYAATMGHADEELGFPAGATAYTRSAAPLMRRFRQTGELIYQGGRPMPVQTEAERQLIEAFFARCA